MYYLTFEDFDVTSTTSDGVKTIYEATTTLRLQENPHFENTFFIISRTSEYSAQKDLLVTEIYKKLMGYSPEVYIVKDCNENGTDQFYIASRKIKFTDTGFNLNENQINKKIKGMAAIFVIAYFLCDVDMRANNYGFVETEDEIIAYKIDNAEALDPYAMRFSMTIDELKQLPYVINLNFTGENTNTMSPLIVESAAFQQEKKDILEKIANLSFSYFATLILQTLTANHEHHLSLEKEELSSSPDKVSSFPRMMFEYRNTRLEKFPINDDLLLAKLHNRHQQLKNMLLEDLTQSVDFAEEVMQSITQESIANKKELMEAIEKREELSLSFS